jgi:K+/H+ antiporter YhaU regulatory subunit KhtT
MSRISRQHVPRTGLLQVLETASGRLGVLLHRDGRRELLVYSDAAGTGDGDSVHIAVELDEHEAADLGELLGATVGQMHLVEVHRDQKRAGFLLLSHSDFAVAEEASKQVE